jgi:hypothetical protein
MMDFLPDTEHLIRLAWIVGAVGALAATVQVYGMLDWQYRLWRQRRLMQRLPELNAQRRIGRACVNAQWAAERRRRGLPPLAHLENQ